MIYPTPHIAPLGDGAVLLEFGNEISDALYAKVQAALVVLTPLAGVELVPAYASILLRYTPTIAYPTIRRRILAALAQAVHTIPDERPIISIPTSYGGEFGPDMAAVCSLHGLSMAEVIKLHTQVVYTVYLLGFAPGFAYLGSLPAELETPRLATPRLRVPPGSVGLAGRQTGIYALSTPGGWQIIGRTNLRLWDATRQPPTLLQPGDRVQFVAE